MDRQRDVIYRYDGSFEGFLCCVFRSYAHHELPFDIWRPETGQTSLFPTESVQTDPAQAQRVYASIQGKLGPQVHRMVMTGFLNGEEGKERKLLLFLRLAYRVGPAAADRLGDPAVADVLELARAVHNEAGQFIQFVRFEERGGMLGAVLSPKHYVLPLMQEHFCNRFPEEDFLLYDDRHALALVHRQGRVSYTQLAEGFLPGPPEQEEARYQALWQRFYQAVAIQERKNLKLRQQHCPKRYWEHMTELRTSL